MTRINIGIPPQELHYKHLLAEHREIKRIPNVISRGRYRLENIPESFTLGRGHVKFFYNKLLYLKKRYESLYQECKRRGYKVGDWSGAWDDVPMCLMNDYLPTERDREIVRERIRERLDSMK